MRRFLSLMILFVGLQIPLFFWIFRFGVSNEASYLSAIVDKHAHARSCRGPRLLLVGGSNLAFGIDSRRLHEDLGIPPCNLGLCAGLGLEFCLGEASELKRRGDVVLLSLELDHYWANQASVEYLGPISKYHPRCLSYIRNDPIYPQVVERFSRSESSDLSQWRVTLDSGLLHWHRCSRRAMLSLRKQRQTVYHRSAFNRYGDMIGHHDLPSTFSAEDIRPTPRNFRKEHVAKIIKRINRFAGDCQAEGVTVLYIHPPVARSLLRSRRDRFEFVHRTLEAQSTVRQLNRIHATVYPDSLFFDSPQHLTREGKAKRTSQWLELLQPILLEPHPEATDSGGIE